MRPLRVPNGYRYPAQCWLAQKIDGKETLTKVDCWPTATNGLAVICVNGKYSITHTKSGLGVMMFWDHQRAITVANLLNGEFNWTLDKVDLTAEVLKAKMAGSWSLSKWLDSNGINREELAS